MAAVHTAEVSPDPFLPPDRRTEGPRQPSLPGISTAQLGMIVLLVSLGVLFVGTLVAYGVTRANAEQWKTALMPELPIGLWGSTLLLAAQTGALHWGLRGIRNNQHQRLVTALWLGTLLGLSFMIGQSFNWYAVWSAAAQTSAGDGSLYLFTFYMLTGVHAVHVVGGLVPLSICLHRARSREYSSSRYEGVKLCVQYWDFLAVVWMVLLATLYLAT